MVYTPLVYKNPGGRRPGEESVNLAHLNLCTATDDCDRRTQFTDQDENNLCNWIAAKIPYKETGGRTGNRLYQQLCDLVSLSHPTKTHNDNVCDIEWRPRICLG